MPLPVLQVHWVSRTSLKANRRLNPPAPPRAVLAALLALALALGGCATPVLAPSVDVPPRFAAGSVAEIEPEVAWWESYGDPVLSDLIAARRVKTATSR